MKVGLALRSTVFSPSSIAKIIPKLDNSEVDSVWFPRVGLAFDALDMCGVSLGESRRLRVGTGVITSADYDSTRLLARVHTLSEGSSSRFVLGIGTGPGTGRAAIHELVGLATGLRASYPEDEKPPIFFAALKKRILNAAYHNADGAILNFCPPSYVEKINPKVRREDFTLACYVKHFFAEDVDVAKRMLVSEMRMYNSFPQYHAMFENAGVSEAISGLDASSVIPQELLQISMANPTDDEVVGSIASFRQAGVTLPILYPYVSGDDSYRMAVVERLSELV